MAALMKNLQGASEGLVYLDAATTVRGDAFPPYGPTFPTTTASRVGTFRPTGPIRAGGLVHYISGGVYSL